MARTRSRSSEKIGAVEIAPVLHYLEKHGIGAQEMHRAWQNKDGLDALVAYTRSRLGQNTANGGEETGEAPATKEGAEARMAIQSWEEFLHCWHACGTQQEATGLLIACAGGREDLYRAYIPVTWPECIEPGNRDAYKAYCKDQWRTRFMFLIDVAGNDPDKSLRHIARHILWEKFLLQMPGIQLQRGHVFWSEIRDVALSEALEFVCAEDLKDYSTAHNVVRFLLSLAGHMIKSRREGYGYNDFIPVVTPHLKDCYILAVKVRDMLPAAASNLGILSHMEISRDWTPNLDGLYSREYFQELGMDDPDTLKNSEKVLTKRQFAKALVDFFQKEAMSARQA